MKLSKKLIACTLAFAVSSSQLFALPIQVTDGGKTTQVSVEPIITQGQTYVPLRGVADQLGYKIGWNIKKKEATLTGKGKEISIDTKALQQKQYGFIKEDRTYVSMKWLEKELGLTMQIQDQSKEVGTLSLEIMNLLSKGNYAAVIKKMDEVSAKMIDETVLKQSFESILTTFGKIKSYTLDEVQKNGDFYQVYVKVITEKAEVKVTMSFNLNKELVGLYFGLYTKEVAKPQGVVEKDMVVTTGRYKLPATLTLPKGEGDFPVVVLVHGSGPNDRDETVGGVKVFRDIAYGLAEQGIATLRYDKRTYVYSQEVQNNPSAFNYDEEVIEDALSAIELMKTTNQIDKDKIFVLGHSLGGMSIPKISTKDSGVAGYLMVAAPARNLIDVVLEQVDYLATVQGMPEAQKAAYMKLMEQQAEIIRSLTPSSQISEMNFMGINNKMWAAFNSYNQVEVAKKITEPLFIVQGGRDYQVTMEDFKRWEQNLKGMTNVTFKAYSDLNHILVTGKGKSTPDEYYMPNEVSKTLVEDMAQWIQAIE